MEIKYDSEVDAMYIELNKGEFGSNKKVAKNIIVNYGKNGAILGIEILAVKELNPALLQDITFRQIAVAA